MHSLISVLAHVRPTFLRHNLPYQILQHQASATDVNQTHNTPHHTPHSTTGGM